MILVVIVTYNGLKWIDSLLQPFVQDREGLEVAVLDNASTDGTPQAIWERYPFVHLTAWGANLGFGAANNKLLEQAIVGDYEGAFLLNQDASITAEAIRALAKYVASYPEIGLLSPKHLNAQGEVESGFAHYLPSEEREPFTEVPFINAALWYLPRRTLETVGLFSPLFQHYGEDLDYAHRVLAEGLKIGYLPSVTAYHYRGNIGECTSEKAYQLKRAYHIAEAVHPLYPKWKRIYRGYLAPLGESVKALFGGTKEDYAHSKRLYHLVRELIAMSSTMKLWQHRPALDVDALRRVYKRGSTAPLILFVYNRPKHTERVLQQLLQQGEIQETKVYIWSDGARDTADESAVNEVRDLCQRYFPDAEMHKQVSNIGLARSVVQGVTYVLERHSRVIVLEDDLVLSPYFLRWINDALELYEQYPEIAHLHAGTFYTTRRLRHNHSLRFAGSWGWGTWRDRWQELWEPDGSKLLEQLQKNPEIRRHFNYGGFMNFTQMLRRQTLGENDSWAVRWHASIVLHGRLSISSNPPLVANAGFDNSGTHSGGGGRYRTAVAPYPLYADSNIMLKEDPKARRILLRYYMVKNNKLAKGWYKLKELLGR